MDSLADYWNDSMLRSTAEHIAAARPPPRIKASLECFHFICVSLWYFTCRYDAEESGTVVDGEDAADVFVGDDKLFAAREAALSQRSGGGAQARLVRADGTRMSLAASKKYSALHADNQQWEDRQLMASGVVRRGEQDLDIDDEEENKAILLVHGNVPRVPAWRPSKRGAHELRRATLLRFLAASPRHPLASMHVSSVASVCLSCFVL